MSYSFPVASRLAPTALVTMISVEADGLRNAKRRARGIARVVIGVPKPIIVTNEHALAVAMRQAAIAKYAPKMPVERSTSPMCFDNRYARSN